MVIETAGVTPGTSLLANDLPGADEPATLTAVDFGLGGGFQAIAAVGTTTLSNVNGTYTFQANGAWTFDPNVNSSNAASISAGFTYRITDSDGDTSTATQAIAIINNLLVVGSPSDDVTGSSADHTVPITVDRSRVRCPAAQATI